MPDEEQMKTPPKDMGTFSVPHVLDAVVLQGVKKTRFSEKFLNQRKIDDAQIGQNESDLKQSFTRSITVFENPDGSKYGVVYTDWVGLDGQTTDDITSYQIRVPLTESQYQTLLESKKEQR